MASSDINPLTFGTKPGYKLYLWAVTSICLLVAILLLVRAIEWMNAVPVTQDPTVLAFLLGPLLFFVVALWMGRWALFHSTAQITADNNGLTMQSAVASDSLRWKDIEAIQLQGLSGSEVKLSGKGHRVTAPSGSAAAVRDTKHLEAWINDRLGNRELKYEGVHFWGP